MINGYLNQTVIWKSATGVNEFNEPSFDPDQQIKCRFESNRKMVRNKEGVEVLSESQMWTLSPIKIDDVIVHDGIELIVIKSNPMYSLNGVILFYEVSL